MFQTFLEARTQRTATPHGIDVRDEPVLGNLRHMQPAATLVIENESGRLALLARAEAHLQRGECLIKIVDVIGLRRSVRTTPLSPDAQLVARELPVVLRGGLTSLVSYYRVPTDALEAKETHYVGDAISHSYDVLLQVARLGMRATPTPAMPA